MGVCCIGWWEWGLQGEDGKGGSGGEFEGSCLHCWRFDIAGWGWMLVFLDDGLVSNQVVDVLETPRGCGLEECG
jgi:hypothetical protein